MVPVTHEVQDGPDIDESWAFMHAAAIEVYRYLCILNVGTFMYAGHVRAGHGGRPPSTFVGFLAVCTDCTDVGKAITVSSANYTLWLGEAVT